MKYIVKNFSNIYVALLLFGAFVIVMPPTILGIPFFLFSLPLRYILLLASFYYIFNGLVKGYYASNMLVVFILFWVFYLVRVVVDLEIRMIPHIVYDTKMGYYQAIVYCFFTSFSFFFIKNLDYRKILHYCYVLLFFGCIVSFYIVSSVSQDLIQRSEGRFEGAQGMSSIDYGHYGVSLSLLSIVYLFGSGPILRKSIYLVGFSIGLIVMYLSGSRSPFLALIFCILSYMSISKGMLRGTVYLLFLLLPLVIFFDDIMGYLDQFESNFITRLIALFDGDRSERDSLFFIGTDQFLSSPLFGDSFLINKGGERGSYPHNLVLESFMALGILGGAMFVFLLIRTIKSLYGIMRNNQSMTWAAVLFLQQFILSLASLSIYSHLKYWYLLSALLAATTMSKKNGKILND